MYTVEPCNDGLYSFAICEDGEVIAWVESSTHSIQRLVNAANYGLGAISDFDPMSSGPVTLAACEPTSQTTDSRDSAGLGAGPMLRNSSGIPLPTAIPPWREGDGWSTGGW